MTFRVRQKVVCISDNWDPCPLTPNVPVENAVYTIREIAEFAKGTGLRFDEIVNPPGKYADGFGEAAFAAQFFRPLVERQTDISVFTAMLNPNQQRVPDEVTS